MNSENTKHLVETYPHLFKNFGYFECSDGWFKLLCELSEKLEPVFKENLPENFRHRVVGQVKQKFGGLRFYLDWYPESEALNEQIENDIEEAEEKSWVTCEFCGEPGKTRGGGWVLVLCDKHHQENLEKKNKRASKNAKNEN